MSTTTFLSDLLRGSRIEIIDGFLSDPEAYLKLIRSDDFHRPERINYPGHVIHFTEELRALLAADLRAHVGTQFPEMRYSRFRRTISSDNGTQSAYIHADDHTIRLLVYLKLPETQEFQGTIFYRQKETGRIRKTESTKMKDMMWDNIISSDHYYDRYWEPWAKVEAKENRAVIFDGHLFHSGPTELYGSGGDDCRINIEAEFLRKDAFALIDQDGSSPGEAAP